MPDTLNNLLHRLRDERPACRVCDRPVDDPDTAALLLIPLDEIGDAQGVIPVHQGACEREARDRLERAQKAVDERRVRQGTEHKWDRAKRLHDAGEAVDLG